MVWPLGKPRWNVTFPKDEFVGVFLEFEKINWLCFGVKNERMKPSDSPAGVKTKYCGKVIGKQLCNGS